MFEVQSPGAVALEAIIAAGHDVPWVLTQPDRPAGRGLQLQASAVKQLALARQLAVMQPAGMRLDGRYAEQAAAARLALQQAAPDVTVVAAYGLILPRWMLELPQHGCLNIHASVLPRWRGAAPIQRAIEAGDSETGITIMRMEEGLDTGPTCLVERTPIRPDDTGTSLHHRLAAMGAALIVRALAQLARGELSCHPQPVEGVSYATKIDKRESAIDWQQSAAAIERRLRAFDPMPGMHLRLGAESFKVWRASVRPGVANGTPGQVVSSLPGALVVACGEDALELLELQRPGGRRLPVRQALGQSVPPVGSQLIHDIALRTD